MTVTEQERTFEEEHGEEATRSAGLAREDNPDLDEALDAEVEPVFEVEVDPELETRDLHEADEQIADPPPRERAAFKPRSARSIPGMGKVYDFRGAGLCPPNGGRMRPLIMVHHIPVVPNKAGIADFITLGNVLRAQGLAIQAATDAEGNVALYTRFDEMCYGHRGANQFASGIEHMHMTVGEAWTEKQMRAAAWCAVQVWNSYAIPPRGAKILPGSRIVKVQRRGHTSHRAVSANAGYNDRSDPGPGFSFPRMYELARFFQKNNRF